MKGNNKQIERIVKIYSEFLLHLVLHDTCDRSEAEDIVQNTFIKYLQKAPEFKDEEHEKAWLIRVASNQVKDVHKSWWRRNTVGMKEDIIQYPCEEDQPFQLLSYVRKLSKHSRHAIYLFYYEGYSVSQIANIYQVSENTVSSWLYRGREKLRSMMEGENIDELGSL